MKTIEKYQLQDDLYKDVHQNDGDDQCSPWELMRCSMKRKSFERRVQKMRHEDDKILYQMRDGTFKMPKCKDVSAKRHRALGDMQTVILMKRQMKRYRKKNSNLFHNTLFMLS